LNLGLAYLKDEQHTNAQPLFERAVAVDSNHLQARQLLALCRLYTGQTEIAVRDLESLYNKNKQDQQLLFLLGFAYLKDNDQVKAKGIFEEMFALAGPAQTEFLLGKACYEAARFDSAEESFLKVARINPSHPGLHLELGKLYISQGRTGDAIRELQSVLQADAANEDANYYLGALLVRESRYAESIPYLEHAVKLRPDSWSAYLYLGRAKLRLEQPADAVTLLRKAAALHPEDPSVYFQLGRALQASGQEEEAVQAFKQSRTVSSQKENQILGIR
jgi:tetratricopeptide (TPR) repeat protein